MSGDAGGLLWISEWTSLMQGINSGLLASFYSDYLSAAKISGITCSGKTFTPQQLKVFAASQVCFHFVLLCFSKTNTLSFYYIIFYLTAGGSFRRKVFFFYFLA